MLIRISLFTLLIILISLSVSAQDLLQTRFSLKKTSGTRGELLNDIRQVTGIEFSYNPNFIRAKENVELKKTTGTLGEFLDIILDDLPISLKVRNKKVLILKKQAEKGQAIIKGVIQEASSGETLIGATIRLQSLEDDTQSYGVISNLYGFYSLTIPSGRYRFIISYIGYQTESREIELDGQLSFDFDLVPSSTQLEEVVVESSSYLLEPDHNYRSSDLGKNTIDIAAVRKMPALFGEVDPIKSIQLLPGVNISGEGSTNFYVRGGNADHNLIQLDEATVYNASHMMGFLSVFNPDALNYMQFYRGHIPAQFGGRLSSLLDIRMKDGDDSNYHLAGGIGITSSRLTAEGPIVKEKSSFILSARRTYLDQFLRFSNDEFTRETRIYFYDLNAKLSYRLNDKNRIYLSGYFGRDLNKILALQYVIDWGNATGTFRWNHLFNDRLFSNTTLLYSKYDYLIDLSDENSAFNWRSKVEDITFKEDLDFYVNPKHLMKIGLQTTLHQFVPGQSDEDPSSGVPNKKSLESAVYFSSDLEISDRLRLNSGLRYSLYQLFGSTTLYSYDNDFNITDEVQTSGNGVYKTYQGFEPRFSVRYLLGSENSLKFSYNRNRQYIQLLSNLSLGLNVFDIWYPSTNQIKPQISDQLSVGYFKNFRKNMYELSTEVYYKRLQNQVDYVDHSTLIMNRELEASLRTGMGYAYGFEMSLRKNGRLNGWISYNYSRAKRKIEGINNFQEYPALFDQPHTVSVVGNYSLSTRWEFSANWNFTSGRPVTLPEETFRYDGYIVPIYGTKNSGRLPDYHRLDVSFTLYPKEKPGRKNQSSWNFSLYNVYSRKNAASVFVTSELADIDLVKNKDRSAFHKLSFFGIIPSVTYNFKF